MTSCYAKAYTRICNNVEYFLSSLKNQRVYKHNFKILRTKLRPEPFDACAIMRIKRFGTQLYLELCFKLACVGSIVLKQKVCLLSYRKLIWCGAWFGRLGAASQHLRKVGLVQVVIGFEIGQHKNKVVELKKDFDCELMVQN